ncbi:hypothetical protein [Bradyrhizobium symbiodeficiens]|uniref:hypothetical protein n=1 Tax=Bradyrhizobium symbiodeficiens TaxID=1404367 RepID=UPI000BC91FF0|nr:hypothetical protein [Bradyrhizobium symbiodeficiens]AWM06080.1 hypothetical protein CIT39_06175 [Bradyrhizobium symbiodeficiens]
MTKAIDATPLFVFGLDESGKPRGARFSELRDEIVRAALDMNCWVLHPAPDDFVPHGMKLPVGRLYASGRTFIPNIRKALYDKLLLTKGENARRLEKENSTESPASTGTTPSVPCVSPITAGLPRSWDEIGVGHMVLIHESAEDGWWETVVENRDGEILTLRYRDFPKAPRATRHIHAVALVNPGPATAS